MNAPTITMDRSEAREKADSYRAALAKRENAEYRQALTIFDALAKGAAVIDVGIAIREGGFDEKMRPRLAIARADRRQVGFHWPHHSDTGRFDANGQWGRQYSQFIHQVNFNRRPEKWVDAYALVPLMPADVRPETGQERDWHILWEVDEWSDTRLGATPDRDPYLLKRLDGDLFVVLAEWDLTEVERMVMQGRARVR